MSQPYDEQSDPALEAEPATETKAGPRQRRRGDMRLTIARTLRLAWQADQRTFVVVFLLTMAPAAIPPVMVELSKRLVDLIALSSLEPVTNSRVLPLVVALGVLAAIQRVVGSLFGTRQELFGRRVYLEAERRFLRQPRALRPKRCHHSRADRVRYESSCSEQRTDRRQNRAAAALPETRLAGAGQHILPRLRAHTSAGDGCLYVSGADGGGFRSINQHLAAQNVETQCAFGIQNRLELAFQDGDFVRAIHSVDPEFENRVFLHCTSQALTLWHVIVSNRFQ